ncbi:hypothetical protein SAMN02927924_02659 [Sphingobium faniae]|nr:hypothetical protein SAMN02927924_02659 [Sphingobium faniae]
MKMTDDEVALGAAMMLLRRHGDLAPQRVAQRIGELALAGDHEGIELWKQIASRMDQILRPGAAH